MVSFNTSSFFFLVDFTSRLMTATTVYIIKFCSLSDDYSVFSIDHNREEMNHPVSVYLNLQKESKQNLSQHA
jgi:hypothetical protein